MTKVEAQNVGYWFLFQLEILWNCLEILTFLLNLVPHSKVPTLFSFYWNKEEKSAGFCREFSKRYICWQTERNFFNEIRRGWNRMRLTRHQALSLWSKIDDWAKIRSHPMMILVKIKKFPAHVRACSSAYSAGGEKLSKLAASSQIITSQPTHSCSPNLLFQQYGSSGNFPCTWYNALIKDACYIDKSKPNDKIFSLHWWCIYDANDQLHNITP